MGDKLVAFFSLADPNIRYVVLGTLLLSISTSLVGSFALLKKRALVGDAVAHAVLPGICIAFMGLGTKQLLGLVTGAFASGWLALLLVDYITQRSKLKEDASIALVLSVSFGMGMLLLSMIQHTGNAAQVGLSSFIFGKAAALVDQDVIILAGLSVGVTAAVLLFLKEFTLVAFDKSFAQSMGLPVRRLELLLTSLTVIAIVIGIRTVGILLISAMLITPSAASLFWTDRFSRMLGVAAGLSAASGLIGSFISYTAPGMPTGPWIVVAMSVMAYFSFLCAPGKGWGARKIRQRRHRRKTLLENVLKMFYELAEADAEFSQARDMEVLRRHRSLPASDIRKGLKWLTDKGMVEKVAEASWKLTLPGIAQAKQVVRRHRLWELYLSRHLNIQFDHVHEDAEAMEHVITPELENELRKLLSDESWHKR